MKLRYLVAVILLVSVGYVAMPRHTQHRVAATAHGHTFSPISETDPRWNCLTMGNRQCGASFRPITSALVDALTEGMSDPDDEGPQSWTGCLADVGSVIRVVCPDGWVTVER